MSKVRLGDVCEIVSGSTPKTSIEEYWNGTFCWITPAEIKENDVVIKDTVRKITQEGANSCSLSLMPIGTVLLTSRAPIGKVAISGTEMYCNQGFKNLICSDIINNKYLFWFLKSKPNYLNSLGRGATFKEISKKIIADIIIPLPSIDEQEQIVFNLDRVNHLIVLCNNTLEKLDILVKSRFVEMFGTLDSPSLDFEFDTLKNLSIKITDGKHGGCTIEEGTTFYFVGAREIYNDSVHYETAPEISADDFHKDYKRCNVENGDFLIVNTGATIGKSAIASGDRTNHTLLQKSVALIKVRKERLLPVFLMYCYKVNERMYKVDSASAQPNLLLSKIKATKIYVPPINQQLQFADFVELVDKQKVEVKKSLEKLETLKKSLMQEYFG